MQLYLCRHGEAIDGSDEIGDEERWLTREGRKGAAQVANVLLQQGDVPDLILTSPLVRAVQTADGFAFALQYAGAVEVLHSLGTRGQLGGVLAALQSLPPQVRRVFLFGHEPQMGEWSAALIGRASLGRVFQKGGVLRIDWSMWPERGSGQPRFYLSPHQLQPVPG